MKCSVCETEMEQEPGYFTVFKCPNCDNIQIVPEASQMEIKTKGDDKIGRNRSNKNISR